MPGRHIAVDQAHAKEIFAAYENESILSIVVFKNGIIDFQRIKDFIDVINSLYAKRKNNKDFISNVKEFYSKKGPNPSCSSKQNHRERLIELDALNNNDNLATFKVECTEDFLFDEKTASVCVYKSKTENKQKGRNNRKGKSNRKGKNKETENTVILSDKGTINFHVINIGSKTSPSFVITHFVKNGSN